MVFRPCRFSLVCICTHSRHEVFFAPPNRSMKECAHTRLEVCRGNRRNGRFPAKTLCRLKSRDGDTKGTKSPGIPPQRAFRHTRSIVFGGQGRDRTGDTRIFSPLLYQLSYLATIVQGLNGRSAGIRTLDPVIKSHLLYQLSYAPIHLGFWSEERDSNPRQPPWQGGTLPTELSSHRENGV